MLTRTYEKMAEKHLSRARTLEGTKNIDTNQK